MKIYIYAIYFPTSNKYYIGQTYDLKRRMDQHFKSGYLICNALWKYDDWQVTILHICKFRDEANRIEIEEIRNFNSIRPNGYNLTRGGEGTVGIKHPELIERNKKGHSKETRAKISKAMKGKKTRLGRHLSEETKEKIRKGNLGNRYSEEVNKKKGTLRNQFAKGKNLGKNNCSHRIGVKIKRLKTRIKKYEQELN